MTLNLIYHGRKHSAREMPEADFMVAAKLAVLRVATTYCAADVSKDKTPNDVWKSCADLLKSQFGSIGTTEIDEAFSLAAAKRIQADLTAYGGKFSVGMFGAVMAAYEDFRRPIVFEIEKQKDQPQEEKPKLTAGQTDQEETPQYTVAGHLKQLQKENTEFSKWREVPIWFAKRVKDLGVFDEIDRDWKVDVWKDCKRLIAQGIEGRMQKAADQMDRAEHKRLSFIKDKIQADPETLPTELNAETLEIYLQRLTFSLFAPYKG